MDLFTSGMPETRKKSHDAQFVLDTRRGEGVRKYFFPYTATIPPGKPETHAGIML